VRYLLVLAAVLALCASASAATRLPGFASCPTGKPVVKPRSITIACADANFYVTNFRWSRWNQAEALATGVGHENDCKPYCAAGHFHTYRVTMRLFRPIACGGGAHAFSRFTYAFVGPKPAGVVRSGTEPSAGCR
jgi:hypothetical protein